MTNWLLFGILVTGVFRVILSLRDAKRVNDLNKAALKRAEEWEKQHQELRNREIADLREIAKASGAMEQILKDFQP